MNRSRWIATGLNGAAAVGFAAFGAHGLSPDLAERLRHAYEAASTIHLAHAAALAALAGRERVFAPAFWTMLAGVLAFSLSLYGLALTGVAVLAHVAPAGGVLLPLAWIAAAVAGAKTQK